MCDAPPEIALALFEDMANYDMQAAFEAVKAPVRCINADGFPTAVETNRNYSDDYDAIIIKNVGHFLMMEKPEEFNRQLRAVLEELQPR
jgi:pimeloyl-ACP methyl ester carboxylesterase